MSGYQPNAYPESRPARLIQRDGGEVIETGWLISSQAYDEADPPRPPMDMGAAIGLAFTILASLAIVLGGIGWVVSNFFHQFWSIL